MVLDQHITDRVGEAAEVHVHLVLDGEVVADIINPMIIKEEELVMVTHPTDHTIQEAGEEVVDMMIIEEGEIGEDQVGMIISSIIHDRTFHQIVMVEEEVDMEEEDIKIIIKTLHEVIHHMTHMNQILWG